MGLEGQGVRSFQECGANLPTSLTYQSRKEALIGLVSESAQSRSFQEIGRNCSTGSIGFGQEGCKNLVD